MLSVLGEKLHDNRFLNLLKYLLKAGYLEDWEYGRTLSGTPQGGVVSPILANIYLDRLDKFVENVLIPAHTRGTARRRNPTWNALRSRMVYQKKVGNYTLAVQQRRELRNLPSGDPSDPEYRRLRYVRYADDFVLGFIGPKAEAGQIKESLETFLRDNLKLELSKEKTLITHAASQAAKFSEPTTSATNSYISEPTTSSTLQGNASSTASWDCGFPPTSSNNTAAPTWATANQHTAPTSYTMMTSLSCERTKMRSGASSNTTC